MKPLKLFTLFIIASLFISCGRTEKAATAVATDFLSAYFATNYPEAAKFCTKDFAAELLESVKDLDSQSEQYREKLSKAAAAVSTSIVSVEEKEDETVLVTYQINIPDTPAIENHLTLVKEEKGFKVSGR